MVLLRMALLALTLLASASALAADGVITVASAFSVHETADRLEAALKKKGMTLFARVDHAAGAQKVGLKLRPTELVIFGNPKAGTPLMRCAQTVALDLPQKALIWQDADGKVWLSYNDPAYLKERHGVKGCAPVLAKITKALEGFARAATQQERAKVKH